MNILGSDKHAPHRPSGKAFVGKKLKWIVLAGASVALLGGATLLLVSTQPPKELASKSLSSNIDTNLATTDPANIPVVLKYKYDLTLVSLKQRPLKGQLTTASMALDIAGMFEQLENYPKALEAYRIADSLKPDTEKDAAYYVQYCQLAFAANEAELARKQCSAGKEALHEFDQDSLYRQETEAKIDTILAIEGGQS